MYGTSSSREYRLSATASYRQPMQKPSRANLKKIGLMTAGSLSLGLGVVGIFIPIMPTTCFLLLAAGCYARSSQRCYDWLMNNRWFGSYIRNYWEGKGIPRRARVFSLAFLWLTTGYSGLVLVQTLWLQCLMFAIAVAVTIHIRSIPMSRRS